MRTLLPRRTVLRGAFGASMALPLLESMVGGPRRARAAAAPRRYFVSFAGQSTGADGDRLHNDYAPATTGPGYDPNSRSVLAPLAADNLARECTIVSGLRVPTAGPGRLAGRFHGGNHGPLLSGVPVPEPDAGSAVIKGITSDQVVAKAVGAATRFPSLQFCVQPKIYSGGPGYGWVISMAEKAGGGLQRLEPTTSPAQAYKSLFYGFTGGTTMDPAAAKAFDAERRLRVSVLDACQASRARLAARLGRADMAVVQEYYDHCRDLENRLQSLTATTVAGCSKPADPGADPPIGGDTFSSMQNNGSVPTGTGWSNETLRARVFMDLTHMAFLCDLTRVVSVVFTRNQCFMSAREITGYGVDMHSLGHRIGGSPSTTKAVSKGLAWHMGHFAYLVKKLRDTRDPTGASLLDTSALVLLNEGGHGPNPAEAAQFNAQDLITNGSSHSMENMICTIAGGAGGLKRGQHVATSGKHPVNVLISLVNAVGVPLQQLGEVSGGVPELIG